MIYNSIFKGHWDKKDTIEHAEIPDNPDPIKSTEVMIYKGYDVFDNVFQRNFLLMVSSIFLESEWYEL